MNTFIIIYTVAITVIYATAFFLYQQTFKKKNKNIDEVVVKPIFTIVFNDELKNSDIERLSGIVLEYEQIEKLKYQSTNTESCENKIFIKHNNINFKNLIMP